MIPIIIIIPVLILGFVKAMKHLAVYIFFGHQLLELHVITFYNTKQYRNN